MSSFWDAVAEAADDAKRAAKKAANKVSEIVDKYSSTPWGRNKDGSGAEEEERPERNDQSQDTTRPAQSAPPAREQSRAERAAEAQSSGAGESRSRAQAAIRGTGATVKDTPTPRGSGAARDTAPKSEPGRGSAQSSPARSSSSGSGAAAPASGTAQSSPARSSSSGSGAAAPASGTAQKGSPCKHIGRPAGFKGPLLVEHCVTYPDRRLGREVDAVICDVLADTKEAGPVTAKMAYYVAYDFYLMAQAFKAEMNATLLIQGSDSHFRDYETQVKLFLQNYEKVNGKWQKKNSSSVTVANPYETTSNHQRGWALDIHVSMSGNDGKADGAEFDNQSRTYKWLAKNAHKYGFTNDEGKRYRVREPWHWAHDNRKFYGGDAKAPAPPAAQVRAETLAQAGSEGPNRTAAKASSAEATATVRAEASQTAGRTAVAAASLGVAATGAEHAQKQAALARRQASLTLPLNYKIAGGETLFNYSSGTWSDGRRT